MKRVFLLVLDSVGVGELPDADLFGDKGSNTLKACFNTGQLNIPFLKKLGIFNIDGLEYGGKCENPIGSFGKLEEVSKGKDTTTGHWEISGLISKEPFPTYPNGFPEELIREFEEKTGRKVLCNKPYSGTKVLMDYGQEHVKTGGLIVYTSADSVWQIAANEEIVPVDELYNYCEIARKMLTGEHSVGRVIARPFVGTYPDYKRTSNRHDYSLTPPVDTMLDYIQYARKDVIGVGKIYDIFNGEGITQFVRTLNNTDGMEKTYEFANKDFEGLCFVNLVDFDMLFGHRNDVKGYTNALNKIDKEINKLAQMLKQDDVLIITADHGCDPSTESTDHSREYIPMLIYGQKIKSGVNLNIRKSFSDIGKTVCDLLDVKNDIEGESFEKLVIKE